MDGISPKAKRRVLCKACWGVPCGSVASGAQEKAPLGEPASTAPVSLKDTSLLPPRPRYDVKGEMLQGQGPTQSLTLYVTGQRKRRGSGKEKKDGEMQEELCSTHNRVWASPDKCIQT